MVHLEFDLRLITVHQAEKELFPEFSWNRAVWTICLKTLNVALINYLLKKNYFLIDDIKIIMLIML